MTQTRKFRIKSAGAAYNLNIGFTPTKVTVWNLTKWATDAQNVKFIWHYGMAAGYALVEVAEDNTINRKIETTNGFTLYDTAALTTNYKVVTGGITDANPGVVTVASTTGWVAGDSLRFQNLVEMTELNNISPIKIVEVLAGGVAFTISDTSSYTAETSVTGKVYNLSKDVEAEGFKGITIGTVPICNDDDILMVEAVLDNEYTNIGDIV